MPRYDYQCPKCGGKVEVIKSLRDLDAPAYCYVCSDPAVVMKRLISCGQVICDLEPYFDENINRTGGEWVTSRQHRKRLMKENNLIERG